jgi:mono/diheme cytochrome c family protein
MKLNDYLSPEELKRLASALLVVLGFIAIAAFFGFTVVPGLRYQAHTTGDAQVLAVQGETGWLDPTDYPAMAREVIPPIDPKTVMTPNPALMTRGKAIYAQTCATCHGADGKGDGPGGAGLNPKPRNFTEKAAWKNGTRLEDIYKTLDEGIKGSSMVSYNYLSKRDRMALAHVVQSLGAFDHGASDPKAIASLEKLFASAGEVIPNRIPVAKAVDALCREYAEARASAAAPSSAIPSTVR